jgi:hypothetical protein
VTGGSNRASEAEKTIASGIGLQIMDRVVKIVDRERQ